MRPISHLIAKLRCSRFRSRRRPLSRRGKRCRPRSRQSQSLGNRHASVLRPPRRRRPRRRNRLHSRPPPSAPRAGPISCPIAQACSPAAPKLCNVSNATRRSCRQRAAAPWPRSAAARPRRRHALGGTIRSTGGGGSTRGRAHRTNADAAPARRAGDRANLQRRSAVALCRCSVRRRPCHQLPRRKRIESVAELLRRAQRGGGSITTIPSGLPYTPAASSRTPL
jgi:hypothetical protein